MYGISSSTTIVTRLTLLTGGVKYIQQDYYRDGVHGISSSTTIVTRLTLLTGGIWYIQQCYYRDGIDSDGRMVYPAVLS